MPQTAQKRPFPRWIALPIAMLVGAMMATQVRINGELGSRLDDGFTAAASAFGMGFLLCLIAVSFSPVARAGLRRVVRGLRDGSIPWFTVLGGLGGAFFVLSQSLVGALVGIAMFSVAVVAGQTLSGLVIDGVGFGPSGRVALTVARLGGAVLILGAVGWSVSGKLAENIGIGALALPVISGILVGLQQAVNGRVRVAAGSTLSATFINFIVGSVVLTSVALIHGLLQPHTLVFPSNPLLYLGGVLGVTFIALSAFIVQHTGVLLLGMGTVAGQLITGVILDIVDHGVAGVGFSTIGGAALALIAALIASLPSPALARGHRIVDPLS